MSSLCPHPGTYLRRLIDDRMALNVAEWCSHCGAIRMWQAQGVFGPWISPEIYNNLKPVLETTTAKH